MLAHMSAWIREGVGASATLAVVCLAASCGEGSPQGSSPTSAGAAGITAGTASNESGASGSNASSGAPAGGSSSSGASHVGGAGAGAGAGAGTSAGAAPSAGTGGSAGGGGSGAGSAGASNLAGAGGGAGAGNPAPGSTLSIYWIDVEGGASTVIAAPNGQTIVVDAGWSDRDANRIVKVLKDELQAKAVDYFITTHYHTDHIGGVPSLAALIPISKFYDHGDSLEPGPDFNNYVSTAGAKRTTGKPGDKLELGDLRLTFVSSATKVIDPALPPGAANPLCSSSSMKSMNGGIENSESLGFLATFGKFKFVDLGDLTWNVEQTLMCPNNRVGSADIFQVSHHGQDISNSPQLVHALAPTVAVMNNGGSKGGAAATFETLKASPGLKDVWSLHRVTANDAEHNAPDDLTANLAGGDQAYFIKAVVDANGSYTLTNGRNGTTKTYASR